MEVKFLSFLNTAKSYISRKNNYTFLLYTLNFILRARLKFNEKYTFKNEYISILFDINPSASCFWPINEHWSQYKYSIHAMYEYNSAEFISVVNLYAFTFIQAFLFTAFRRFLAFLYITIVDYLKHFNWVPTVINMVMRIYVIYIHFFFCNTRRL